MLCDDIPKTAPCTAASIKHLYARFATTKSATYGVVKSQTELYPVNWHMNTGNPKQKLAKTTQCANSPSKHCLNAEVVQVIDIITLGPHGSSDPPTQAPTGHSKKVSLSEHRLDFWGCNRHCYRHRRSTSAAANPGLPCGCPAQLGHRQP